MSGGEQCGGRVQVLVAISYLQGARMLTSEGLARSATVAHLTGRVKDYITGQYL